MSNVYPHATRMSVVVKSLAEAGKLAADLAPYELGVLDNKTWRSVDATGIPAVKQLRFAVGSPNVGQKNVGPKGISNLYSNTESMKSNAWFSIEDWYSVSPKEIKPFIGYFGFNGFNDCEVEKYECGKTYNYRAAVYGEIVERVFSQWRIEEEFAYSTPCCKECQSSDCSKVDPKIGYTELVKLINSCDKLSRFGYATLVSSCDEEDAIETEPAKVMELTLCDKGDNEALSFVKAQYPGKNITRVRRIGNSSVYSVCVLALEVLAPYVLNAGFYPAQNCEECRAGDTEVESSLNGDIQCTTAEQTAAWTKVADKTKPIRTLESIFRYDCDMDQAKIEAEAEATFGASGDYFFDIIDVELELLDCVGKIKVKQIGLDCLGEDCDSAEIASSNFTKLPTFKGGVLTEAVCSTEETTNEGCKVGIKWTSFIPSEVAEFCGRNPYEFQESNVAAFEMYQTIGMEFPETDCAASAIPFWVAQRGTARTLYGYQVIKDILLYRKYRGEWHINPESEHGMAYLQAEGNVLGVDAAKKYYAVHLTGNYSEITSLSSSFGDKLEDLVVYFESLELRDEFIELVKMSKLHKDEEIRFEK